MGHYYDCTHCGQEKGHAPGCPSRRTPKASQPCDSYHSRIQYGVCTNCGWPQSNHSFGKQGQPSPVAGRKKRVDQTIEAYHDGRNLDSRDIPDLIAELESVRKKLKRKGRVLGARKKK